MFSFLSDLCRGVNCKHGAHCEQGLCVCPTNCPQSEETLCATDMTTVSAYYKNIVAAFVAGATPTTTGTAPASSMLSCTGRKVGGLPTSRSTCTEHASSSGCAVRARTGTARCVAVSLSMTRAPSPTSYSLSATCGSSFVLSIMPS